MTSQSARENIITDIVKKITKVEEIQDYKVETEEIGCTGSNYTAALYFIKIISDNGSLDLFAKIANAPDGEREVLKIKERFVREVFVYTELVDHYNDLQHKHKIPNEQRFNFIKLYASNITATGEIIVLENLAAKGYSTPDRFEPMDWVFASKAIIQLAKFHALSYVFEHKNPKLFNVLIKSKEEFVYSQCRPQCPNMYDKYVKDRINSAIESLDEDDAAKMMKFVKGRDLGQGYIDQNKLQRRPCLIHGDYKHANLMVKYEKKKLVDLCPVDYQQVHYGSPINDLMYFIFSGSDEKFRNEYYDQLIELYYSSLTSSLTQFSLKASDVYPREDFDSDLKERTIFGLHIGLFILPYMLATEKPDFTKTADKLTIDNGAEFKERFRGIFKDFKKWGYFT